MAQTYTRPIIFIAHSLGGIVVKSVSHHLNATRNPWYSREQALIHSDAAREGALEEHRSIKLSTYGILFMGTPHQGGGGVHLVELMLNVASIFVRISNGILQHLERDSEWLQQQLGQYAPISRDFVTKFAYEMLPTPIALGRKKMVSIIFSVPASRLWDSDCATAFGGCSRCCRCRINCHTSRSS